MQNLLLVLALSLFASTAAFGSGVEGVWYLKERRCSNGEQPNDLASIGDSKIILSIGSNVAVLTSSIAGCVSVVESSYTLTSNGVLFYDPKHVIVSGDCGPGGPAMANNSFMRLTSHRNLTLESTTEFEEGGSCPVGEKLTIEFERK
jgi:hypothetical protein